MGNFAENLNLGNRVRPPLLKTRKYFAPSFLVITWNEISVLYLLVKKKKSAAPFHAD